MTPSAQPIEGIEICSPMSGTFYKVGQRSAGAVGAAARLQAGAG